MSGIDSLIEHQGFYDYINHFVSGSILIIGIEMIARTLGVSLILTIYEFIGILSMSKEVNVFLWNTCVISLFLLIAFLVGIALQELYGIIYRSERKNSNKKQENMGKDKENDVLNSESSQKNDLEIQRDIWKYTIRFLKKTTVEGCIINIFSPNGPITNSEKRARYLELAKGFISETSIFKKTDYHLDDLVKQDDVVSYFFTHCVYYIQIKNQNRKTEKLRDVEGLSEALSLAFLILSIFSIVTILINILFNRQNNAEGIIWSIAICVISAVFSVLMDCRTEKSINNRIRMTLAIYDVEMRREAEKTFDWSR